MLTRCHLTNIAGTQTRYPTIDLTSFTHLPKLLVLLSSEPYPFHQKHVEEIRSILPQADIRLVDGEAFSWYGSRLVHSPSYFHQLFSPRS